MPATQNIEDAALDTCYNCGAIYDEDSAGGVCPSCEECPLGQALQVNKRLEAENESLREQIEKLKSEHGHA